MNIKKMACAAAVLGCVAAATAADEAAEAEKGEVEEEAPIVSAEFGLQFDSKYMTYGVVDGKDPILTPSAQITFFDWLYFGVESIFDVTKGNGKRGDYGNRAGRWTTLDAIVGIAHEFELTEDIGLSVDANYIYEYLRRHHSDMGDTQYINLELGLTGLWLEPTLAIERDLMADDGTYVNFSLAHTFTLVGDDDDPTLTFTPSVGQGFGNTQRTLHRLQRLLVRLEAPRRRACLQRRLGPRRQVCRLVERLRRSRRYGLVLTLRGLARQRARNATRREDAASQVAIGSAALPNRCAAPGANIFPNALKAGLNTWHM